MRYFTRTKKLSNILLFGSIALLIAVTAILFKGAVGDQIFLYSNGNFVKNGILFAMLLMGSVFSLMLSIALKVLIRDAQEELDALNGIGTNIPTKG